ncbi:protein of unknown function [Tenacibaculum sp. 190130A14a]
MRIAKYLIQQDSLHVYRYSGKVYLHLYSEAINKNAYKTYASVNGLTSESLDFTSEETTIDGFPTVFYYSLSDKKNIPTVFYVPDAKSWQFFSQLLNDDIYLNELKPIYEFDQKDLEKEDFEPDF